MKNLKYVNGDVCNPLGEDSKLIIHVVNDMGAMGAGVAKALFSKWYDVRKRYLEWYEKNNQLNLGTIQAIKVEKNIVVINMVAQHKIGYENNLPPIRYDALTQCIIKVQNLAKKYTASVHIPYNMGCGLAGGKWDVVEDIIINNLCKEDIPVVIYDIDNIRKE